MMFRIDALIDTKLRRDIPEEGAPGEKTHQEKSESKSEISAHSVVSLPSYRSIELRPTHMHIECGVGRILLP